MRKKRTTNGQNLTDMKKIVGDVLFPQIQVMEPTLAGKITAMLLELDMKELQPLLTDHKRLLTKVNEAVAVLKNHQLVLRQRSMTESKIEHREELVHPHSKLSVDELRHIGFRNLTILVIDGLPPDINAGKIGSTFNGVCSVEINEHPDETRYKWAWVTFQTSAFRQAAKQLIGTDTDWGFYTNLFPGYKVKCMC